MWATPTKSLETTTIFSTPHLTDYNFQQQQFPSNIPTDTKYQRLFKSIYKSNQKFARCNKIQKNENLQKNIENKITGEIEEKKIQAQFEKKFGYLGRPQFQGLFTNKIANQIGLTSNQSNKQDLTDFFSDANQAFQLDEKTRLTEFFLRDLPENQKSIDYVDKVQLNSRFRRVSRAKSAMQERLLYHNQRQYRHLQKTLYINKDQSIEKAVQRAKTRPAYRRKQNFQSKQYIVNQLNHHLITNRNIESNKIKEQRFNIMKKCFMCLAECSESNRAYYSYIDPENLNKIYRFFIEDQEKAVISEQEFKKIIHRIIKYKYRKVIEFEDFRELIEQLEEKLGDHQPLNLSECFERAVVKGLHKVTAMYAKIDEFKWENKIEIEKYLKKHKLQTSLLLLYSKSEDIIDKKYLPLNTLISLMKKHGLTPKIVQMTKLMGACQWNQQRSQGFTIQQLKQVQLTLVFLMDMKMESLAKYMKKFSFVGFNKK